MSSAPSVSFDSVTLLSTLERLDAIELDALAFGVIGFDEQEKVVRYNAFESNLAGLSRERMLGRSLFAVVAPCMNNYLVAQRFQDAAATGVCLDMLLDYVFTLKMRPRKVRLRLLASPGCATRYVAVNWSEA